MKWTLKRDSTGWPWLEGDGWTIAKFVLGDRTEYRLFHGRDRIRVLTAEEVATALQGEWDVVP